MKRYSQLCESISSFENLWAAAYRARRGKRYRPDVLAFHHDLENQLFTLREKLLHETYQPGPYRTFPIRDPKPRLISVASYRDRVVHHAICQIIEPLYDRSFIDDSYANRLGRGTHKAVARCTYFARRYPYVLKCDIQKYFPSIDHEILKILIAQKIKCPRTLRLAGKIIDNSNPQEEVVQYLPGDDLFTSLERRKGIPIGNLTSQFFGNVYLNGMDHYIKEALHCGASLRFADDFLVFKDEKGRLHAILRSLQNYLNRLRLKLHPHKCQVSPTVHGVEFLGWIIYPDHRRVRRSTGLRFQRQLRKLQQAYVKGWIDLNSVKASIMSWIGHLQHGDTHGLRRKLLESAVFSRSAECCTTGE